MARKRTQHAEAHEAEQSTPQVMAESVTGAASMTEQPQTVGPAVDHVLANAQSSSQPHREPGDDSHLEERSRKKWTPPADPFGLENHKTTDNRVRLLKSDREGAWVIRFAHNPNVGNDPAGTPYGKDNPHPVLKMLKDEGYRWGFDGGDGQGGWGKQWSNDPYGADHIEARRVMAKAAEMLGLVKDEGRQPF